MLAIPVQRGPLIVARAARQPSATTIAPQMPLMVPPIRLMPSGILWALAVAVAARVRRAAAPARRLVLARLRLARLTIAVPAMSAVGAERHVPVQRPGARMASAMVASTLIGAESRAMPDIRRRRELWAPGNFANSSVAFRVRNPPLRRGIFRCGGIRD